MSAVNLEFPGNLAELDTAQELRRLPSALVSGILCVVTELGNIFKYDSASVSVDDGTTIIRPLDRTPLQGGRWLKSGNGFAAGPKGDPGPSSVIYTPSGANAVPRPTLDKVGDIVSRSDYTTLSAAYTAAGFRPLVDPTTGKVFLNTDPTPLDYSNTRAGFVFQHSDDADGATNDIIPAEVHQFSASGDGIVFPLSELSTTIWVGQFNYMKKTGDGSGHTYTSIGELGPYGASGYNELGMYQGEMTNVGSVLGTMSGLEMLLKDSPNGGTNAYSTKMQAVVGRIAKYNPTIRESFNFYASCEGTQAINGVIGVNPGGLATWLRGFDFKGATFTSGQFGLAPNNTSMAWLLNGGGTAAVMVVNNANDVKIAATTTGNRVSFTNSVFADRLSADNDASNAVLIWVGGALKRVTAGANDSAGAGFQQLKVPN